MRNKGKSIAQSAKAVRYTARNGQWFDGKAQAKKDRLAGTIQTRPGGATLCMLSWNAKMGIEWWEGYIDEIGADNARYTR